MYILASDLVGQRHLICIEVKNLECGLEARKFLALNLTIICV